MTSWGESITFKSGRFILDTDEVAVLLGSRLSLIWKSQKGAVLGSLVGGVGDAALIFFNLSLAAA
jgi:hypothetical protein